MRHDAIIIGGSFAGLSAATYIVRGRRSVAVIDAGLPRNRFTTHSHGFLGQDGSDPAAMLAIARAQVASYPTVTFFAGSAIRATSVAEGFSVDLATGEKVEASRLVLAFGISDELPAIPGLRARWGSSVLHCPYCHGYEVSGQRLGVLYVTPQSIHQAMLIAEWGPTTLYLNDLDGVGEADAALLVELEARNVAIEPAAVVALHGEGAQLAAIELADGRMSSADALFLGPRNHLNSDLAQQLGCALDEAPLGLMIRTDAQKMTTVPGVYAAGDITRGAHTVAFACADGVTAGIALHRSLVF
jgi:thioredoxin reductase